MIRAHSGSPAKGKLVGKEYRKCRITGTVFERRSDITDERECDRFEQSKRWDKKQEPPTFSRIYSV